MRCGYWKLSVRVRHGGVYVGEAAEEEAAVVEEGTAVGLEDEASCAPAINHSKAEAANGEASFMMSGVVLCVQEKGEEAAGEVCCSHKIAMYGGLMDHGVTESRAAIQLKYSPLPTAS